MVEIKEEEQLPFGEGPILHLSKKKLMNKMKIENGSIAGIHCSKCF